MQDDDSLQRLHVAAAVLPAMLDVVLIQTGKILRDSSCHDLADVEKARIRFDESVLPAHTRFQEALQEIEQEIIKATAVMQRDLSRMRKKREDGAYKGSPQNTPKSPERDLTQLSTASIDVGSPQESLLDPLFDDVEGTSSFDINAMNDLIPDTTLLAQVDTPSNEIAKSLNELGEPEPSTMKNLDIDLDELFGALPSGDQADVNGASSTTLDPGQSPDFALSAEDAAAVVDVATDMAVSIENSASTIQQSTAEQDQALTPTLDDIVSFTNTPTTQEMPSTKQPALEAKTEDASTGSASAFEDMMMLDFDDFDKAWSG